MSHKKSLQQIIDEEITEESLFQNDMWWLADPDRLDEYWHGCPAYIAQYHIEDFDNRWSMYYETMQALW